MCRFLTYSGPLTLMRPLIFSTENSLVEQSKYSKKRVRPVNGDGFGVGWYPDFDDPEPGTFLSIEPAWSNLNLAHISSKIRTQNFFAHVRDASVGMPVSEANCHPFQYGRFLWMHNGRLDQFTRFKRLLINQLSDKAYAMINGTTDSEHAFALFLDEISFDDTADAVEMERAMIATIRRLMYLRKASGAITNSFINFAVTNGQTTIVTRFVTRRGARPASLFCIKGSLEVRQGGRCEFGLSRDDSQNALVVASEPLTQNEEIWTQVENNHIVIVHPDRRLEIRRIPLPYQGELSLRKEMLQQQRVKALAS